MFVYHRLTVFTSLSCGKSNSGSPACGCDGQLGEGDVHKDPQSFLATFAMEVRLMHYCDLIENDVAAVNFYAWNLFRNVYIAGTWLDWIEKIVQTSKI